MSLTMRHSCWSSFSHAERVATHKVRPWGIWVIQCVEKERSGWGQKILDVLLKGVDVLAAGSLGDKTVVVNGVDVLFAGNCIAKTSAGTVFVANAPGLVA